MFKYLVFVCVIAITFANPGVLAPSLRIAAAPSVNIVRSAPIALGLGSSIGAPLTLSGGLVSNGLLSNGIVSNGLFADGLISKGLVSNGIINGGKLLSGGLLSTGLVSGGLLSGALIQ